MTFASTCHSQSLGVSECGGGGDGPRGRGRRRARSRRSVHIRRHLGKLPARLIAPDPAALRARRAVALRVVAPLLELCEPLLLLRDSNYVIIE